MSIRRVLLRGFICLFILLAGLSVVSAQRQDIDSILFNTEVFDTSDYIPAFYPGSFDYNLMIASSRGYVSEIDRLISKGADIDAVTDEGANALVFAVANSRYDAVMELLKFNPDINHATSSWETPLLIAVKNLNFEICEALIRAGADLEYHDRRGVTPLHHAVISGNLQFVDLLLYYGVNTEAKTYQGTTPLTASILSGYPDISDLLIQNGANLEARDNDGFTPFLTASYIGDTLMMGMLYKNGVDIYAINNSGYNALALTILANQRSASELLFSIGDKWSEKMESTVNPYRVASKYQRRDMINLLKKNNVPGQLKHEIDQMSVNASSRLSLHDIYSGVSLSFKEPYLNAGFTAGCDIKFWYTRVLVKSSENLFYQYMDKGAVAYAGLFKDFKLTDKPDKINLSFSTSLLAGYSFGNKLKGTLISPENDFLLIPAISFKMTKQKYSVNMGIEYVQSQYYKTGPVWLRIGISYYHFFDSVRTNFRTIKWY